MNKVEERILEHFNFLVEKHQVPENKILGIFLYGSQNYGCSHINSDIDTKAIYIPDLAESIVGRPKVHTYILENGEHCELIDIRSYISNLYKQNMNFVETLFTEFYYISPKYKELWKKYFIENRERIAYYDMSKGIQSMIGQTLHTLDQNPTNGKKVGNAYRMMWSLNNYFRMKPYSEVIRLDKNKRRTIRSFKEKEYIDPVYAKIIKQTLARNKEIYLKNVKKINMIERVDIEEILTNAVVECVLTCEGIYGKK